MLLETYFYRDHSHFMIITLPWKYVLVIFSVGTRIILFTQKNSVMKTYSRTVVDVECNLYICICIYDCTYINDRGLCEIKGPIQLTPSQRDGEWDYEPRISFIPGNLWIFSSSGRPTSSKFDITLSLIIYINTYIA